MNEARMVIAFLFLLYRPDRLHRRHGRRSIEKKSPERERRDSMCFVSFINDISKGHWSTIVCVYFDSRLSRFGGEFPSIFASDSNSSSIELFALHRENPSWRETFLCFELSRQAEAIMLVQSPKCVASAIDSRLTLRVLTEILSRALSVLLSKIWAQISIIVVQILHHKFSLNRHCPAPRHRASAQNSKNDCRFSVSNKIILHIAWFFRA